MARALRSAPPRQVAHRALLVEAEFYQLGGLCELLQQKLLGLEDKGEKLRRLSIDTAPAISRDPARPRPP